MMKKGLKKLPFFTCFLLNPAEKVRIAIFDAFWRNQRCFSSFMRIFLPFSYTAYEI